VAAIITNGQLPDRIKDLPELELLDNICFSLDGNREGNDYIRGKGSYDKVIESINKIRKYCKTPIKICSTIHKYVIDDADFIAEFAKQNKINWNINFLFGGDEKFGGADLALSNDEMKKYASKLIELKKRGYPIFISNAALDYIRKWLNCSNSVFLSEYELIEKKFVMPIKCQYGNYEIFIDNDLKVYPCPILQNKFNAKNIAEVGFDEAFDNLINKPCFSCYVPSMINTALIFDWNLSAVLDTVSGLIKKV